MSYEYSESRGGRNKRRKVKRTGLPDFPENKLPSGRGAGTRSAARAQERALGDKNQRSQGRAGYEGQVEDPLAVNLGVKSPDEYVSAKKEGYDQLGRYEKIATDEYDKIRNMKPATTGSIGAGTPDNPFTGTRNAPSGFAEATAEDIALRNANTENGKYAAGFYGGDISRANAAYDLYRDQQMAQVAKNDQGFEELMAYNANKKAGEQLDRERVRMRHEKARGNITARRYGEYMDKTAQRQAELADQALEPQRIANVRRATEAEAAKAGAGQARAMADIYKADASRYRTDTEAGTKLAELDQKEMARREARYYSPKEANDAILGVVKSGDYPEQLMNNEAFMRQAEEMVMSGMDPRDVIGILSKRALGTKQGA